MISLTVEMLRERFLYEPETGIFRHLRAFDCPKKVNEIAGSLGSNGYRYIGAYGGRFLAHRLAWLYMTGKLPDGEIDHINTKRDDNRWINLRLASRSLNHGNIRKPRSSTSGLKGVNFQRGKWRANICKDGKQYHLGRFETREEAFVAYCNAARRLFGKYARFG